jgi:hypothetical protein
MVCVKVRAYVRHIGGECWHFVAPFPAVPRFSCSALSCLKAGSDHGSPVGVPLKFARVACLCAPGGSAVFRGAVRGVAVRVEQKGQRACSGRHCVQGERWERTLSHRVV